MNKPNKKKTNSIMLDIKGSADYLSRSTGSFSNFSMLFAGNNQTGFLSKIFYIFTKWSSSNWNKMSLILLSAQNVDKYECDYFDKFCHIN